MRLRGKIPVFVLGGLAAVVLAAGPAVAHECYNASRSDKGNEQDTDKNATYHITMGKI